MRLWNFAELHLTTFPLNAKMDFIVSTTDDLIHKALTYANNAHAGQIDRDGFPHIFHCVRVASKATSPHMTIVALLHDILEDTDITAEELAKEFGDEIAKDVQDLTRGEIEIWERYIHRVCMNPIARCVKIADIMDNITRQAKPHKIVKYKWALDILQNSPPLYAKSIRHNRD
jgi:(p)ppGpp synthase/HD superfamily hydrolase